MFTNKALPNPTFPPNMNLVYAPSKVIEKSQFIIIVSMLLFNMHAHAYSLSTANSMGSLVPNPLLSKLHDEAQGLGLEKVGRNC
jgi:hypothetical protein